MSDLLTSAEIILDCLSDGVYVCDRKRQMVYWGKSAQRITGWRPEDVVGRLCLENVLCHEDKDGNRYLATAPSRFAMTRMNCSALMVWQEFSQVLITSRINSIWMSCKKNC